MVQGPTFLSLPARRQVSETWLQKRLPGRNIGEHRLVRRSGTTSRGTVALVFCLRMRSYPRTEVLFTFVEKTSTQGRLNSTTRCHSLCYGQKIKLSRIDFDDLSRRLQFVSNPLVSKRPNSITKVYKLVTLRSQPPRLLVYMLRVRFPWFFISPFWVPQRD